MSCDFEDPDLCGWSHDPTHDFDWKRNQFSTPSGHAGTGPSFDHTFGEGKGGFYLYMEASAPRAVNDTARLFSPVYPPEYSGGCFIFWYHMFGSTTEYPLTKFLKNGIPDHERYYKYYN
ncbi:MAM and LDL-receptor class A domain-containing protein 1 [Trichonephila inaurata madagascariensis]|uniref:MAM and LDL-receptor class A domain-containing protein 1 n=1 Tax=Trichonephila inaurata madagascariensis TaxID=2747483 RepID=A0A8X6MFV6_9ARAC|nr:MAM and LDL-receptor class A domain-containing protein 1 [Trichonephila inaurata madagascariensis]